MVVKILLLFLCLNVVRCQEHNHDVKSDLFFFTKKVIKNLLEPDHDWKTSVLMSPFAMEFGVGVVAFGATGKTLEEITNSSGTHLLESWIGHKHGYARRLIADMRDMTRGQVNVELEAGTVMAVNTDYMPYRKFKDEALYWFNAEVQPLTFEWQQLAATNLSDYVSAHTGGRIQDLVHSSDISPDAPLFVASYMDISVKWANRFDEDESEMETFYGLNDTKRINHVMKGKFFATVSQNDNLQAKILSLPLQGGNLTMTFVLPNKRNGIEILLPKLIDDLEVLWEPAKNNSKYVPVHVILPKFKIDSSIDGKKLLNQMGIKKVFEPEAELEKIAEGPNLHLSQIKQKSVIELDEWGVNSAAGTKVKIEEADSPRAQPIVTFNADHPFVFTMTIKPRNDVLFFGVYGG